MQPSPVQDSVDLTALLLGVTETLTRELRPGRPPTVTPTSRLDRDLGLDSLSRVELLDRVERACGVRLDARAAADATTVADLVRLVGSAEVLETASLPERIAMPSEGIQLPTEARTLIEVLDFHAQRHADRNQIWLYDDDDRVAELSFGALLAAAEEVAGGLVERGLKPRQAVALMLPTGQDFFAAFFGILLAGGTPVPLYPPVRPSQVEEHLRRQAGILRTAEAPFLITIPQVKPLGRFLRGQVPTLRDLPTVAELKSTRLQTRPDIKGDDLAFLQFTSGSTGDPKGVMLTHANLLANMRVIVETCGPTPEDVFVSWLPLYHDMGLIGAVLTTWYQALPLVLMSPLRFLMRPERWLRAIHRHRGTMSAAPNFAYELCSKKVPEEALETLDLSTWKMTLNGAEPISPATMDRFATRFARCGYRAETMTPTYGLAEGSLALTITPVPRAPIVDRVERATFSRQGRATPVAEGDADALEFVNCGPPVRGHQVRIMDDAGRELPERREGRIQFRGPSATTGYLRNPEATQALVLPHGWLDSGDLGYLAGGELYVTGRKKDVIIRGGRNLYPHELEERVGDLQGIRKGCVVVFGARREGEATEQLVVVAELREDDAATQQRLEEQIRDAAVDLLGEPPDAIVLAPPHTVLKTSSGKVRRDACKKLYESGQLLAGHRAVWLQVARMNATGWLHTLRARTGGALETAWAGHFWTLFTGMWAMNWAVVAVLPGRKRRWRFTGRAARAFLGAIGCKLEIEHAERITPEGPAVLIANHQSYVDGMILAAFLPRDAAVVAKRELENNVMTRVLMRRLGAILVDRFDATTDQAALIPEALAEGRLVVVFPEGTCLRMPGLLPFQLGAFQSAAAAGVPLIPVTLRGTRTLLRPSQWFPRRTSISVEVGEPLTPDGSDFQAALRLRERARAVILAACGEPDLQREDARVHFDPSQRD